MVEPLFIKLDLQASNIGATITLDGDEAKHAVAVRRMRVGEAIALTNARGLRVRGVVAAINGKTLDLKVSEVSEQAEPQLQITLIQALAKGDRDELAIQAATELGVMRVIPWQAERSISRWVAEKADKGQQRWQTICDEAAKQSLRAWHPRVESVSSSRQLVNLFGQFDRVLLLDPYAEHGLGLAIKPMGKIALIVGPEGGIDDSELNLFAEAGAERVHLGSSILRTSTAGVAAIAAIQALLGEFN